MLRPIHKGCFQNGQGCARPKKKRQVAGTLKLVGALLGIATLVAIALSSRQVTRDLF